MSKADGAVDSHEREMKCLGLSYTFKANCAILLLSANTTREQKRAGPAGMREANFGEFTWECTVPIFVTHGGCGNKVRLKKSSRFAAV